MIYANTLLPFYTFLPPPSSPISQPPPPSPISLPPLPSPTPPLPKIDAIMEPAHRTMLSLCYSTTRLPELVDFLDSSSNAGAPGRRTTGVGFESISQGPGSSVFGQLDQAALRTGLQSFLAGGAQSGGIRTSSGLYFVNFVFFSVFWVCIL